eukprot:COSAG01_NODE_23792_length_801_cov_9.273504_1_plen_148_part_10
MRHETSSDLLRSDLTCMPRNSYEYRPLYCTVFLAGMKVDRMLPDAAASPFCQRPRLQERPTAPTSQRLQVVGAANRLVSTLPERIGLTAASCGCPFLGPRRPPPVWALWAGRRSGNVTQDTPDNDTIMFKAMTVQRLRVVAGTSKPFV